MKKIINSKLYDTDTAEVIGSYGYSGWDYYIGEMLYRKHTGEFFLHRAEDIRTSYSISSGDEWMSCGECIIPYTEKDAKAWAEKHLDVDTYIGIFGAVEE